MAQGRRGTRGREVEPPADGARAPGSALERLRKRDGRIVPFQRQKIADAVLKAMEAAGEPDPALAAEIAGIVELSLVERALSESADPRTTPAGALVTSGEEVGDLVERALMELGRPAVAKSYILHRDRRARIRSALRVHRSDGLRTPVRVRESEGVSSWSKGRIVAVLMEEAELAREAAEDVAAAVEARVFGSGLKRVTSGLVRELVAGELFERGFHHALNVSRVVGLARHDVRRVLSGLPLHPWRPFYARGGPPRGADGLERCLAGELQTRYALENVLPEGAGELHRSGDVHVIGLDHLDRPLALCVDLELLGGAGDPARRAWASLEEIAGLARAVARAVVLERPAEMLSPLSRTTREGSPLGLSAWLRALGALARAAGTRIDLGTCGPRYRAFAARLVEELADLPEDSFDGALYVEGHELEELLRERPDLATCVERLFALGRAVPTWNDEREAFAGPGCHRKRGESGVIACSGAIALNLPRLARRAGPFREELFQSGLAELVTVSVEIARAMRSFQAQGSSLRPRGLAARGSFALVPVGLREALLALGDGSLDADQGARVLGFLGEAASRFARDDLLGAVPCPFFGEEAARRFRYLDRRAAEASGARQEWLFDGALADEERPYGEGFALSSSAAPSAGRLEAEALKTVPAGCLALDRVPVESEPASEHPRLEVWRRFEVWRRTHVGEFVVELFPRPLPSATSGERSRVRPLV